MLRFYGRLCWAVPRLLFNATDLVLTCVAVVVFIVALYNRDWGKAVIAAWDGFSPWWAAAPIVLLVVYGLLKANYEDRRVIEMHVAALSTEVRQLNARLERRFAIELGPTVHTDNLDTSPPAYPVLRAARTIRVRNLSTATTIEDVRVFATWHAPGRNDGLRQLLRRASEPFSAAPSQTFILDPEGYELIDVVVIESRRSGTDRIALGLARPGVLPLIPVVPDTYRITVEGRDVPPVSRFVAITLDSSGREDSLRLTLADG